MAGKKKGGKKGKAKKTKLIGGHTPAELVRKFHKTYERNCVLHQTAVAQSIHKLIGPCIENDTLLVKVNTELKSSISDTNY